MKLNHKLITAFCVGILAAAFASLPTDVNATSGEATEVLGPVASGNLDGKEIEVVELEYEDLQADFTAVMQGALDYAKDRNDGKITRIVIPDGEYQPTGRALEIYSNTILDLRGSGADTPEDTSDDDGNVIIYQTTRDDDPPSLRCGHQDKNGGDESSGYDFYQNMTILGGTFVGERQDGSTSGNACNVRFGHASNIRIIGTEIKENHGGHHLEIGASKDILIADCSFSGYQDGAATETSAEALSLEAIQFDVSHRENNNFAYYGAHDDLPACDALVTGCTFDNVRRGVGTHHAVFGKPYDNIVIKNNTFTNIRDKAVYFVYTKNAEIANNTIQDAVDGIFFQYMTPAQQFQPNSGAAWTAAMAKDFSSSSKIHDNQIYLDDTKKIDSKLPDTNKFGIFVGGQNVTTAISGACPAGTFYLCGVEVSNNTIGISKGSLKEVHAALMAQLAASCVFTDNTIDLKGYNAGTGDSHAGILVYKSPNITVSSNTVKGITNGTKADGILISTCGGTKSVLVTGNQVYNAKRYGVNCYKVTNKNLSVWKNTIKDAGTAGIKITDSKMYNVTTNTVGITGSKRMTDPSISITGSTANLVSFNTVSGTSGHGLFLSASEIYQAKSNKITSPGASGIAVYQGSKAKYLTSNTIESPAKHGIMVYNKSYVESIYGNKVNKAGTNGVYVGDASGVTPQSKAYLIQANTLTGCKSRGVSNSAWVNAIVSNTCKSCGNSNKVYIKKGLSLSKYQVPLTKGKTYTIPYLKSSATKSAVKWSTSNKKIATVTKAGKVKGIGKGTCYIYAKRDGVTVKAKVTVK